MARTRTRVTRTTPTRTWAPTPSIPATVLTPEERHGRRTSPSGHRAHGLTAPCRRAPDSSRALPAAGHASRASTPARGYALRTRCPAPAVLGRAPRAAALGRARVVPVLCQIRPSPRTSSPCTPTAGPYPRAARASSTVRRRPARTPTADGDGSQAADLGGQAGQVPPTDRDPRVMGRPMVPAASGSGLDSPVTSHTARGRRVRNTSARRALGLAGSGPASQERVSTGQGSPAPASPEAPTSAPASQVKGRTAQASTARVSQDQASMVPGQAPTDPEQGRMGRARGSTDPAGSRTSRTRAPIPTHTRRAGTGTVRDPVPTVPPRTRGDAVHQVPAMAPRRNGPVQDRWGPGSRAAGRAAHGSLAPPASTGKARTARDLTARTASAPISTAPISMVLGSMVLGSMAPSSTAPGSTGRPSKGQAGQVLASTDRDPAVGSHVRVRKGLASGDLAAGRVRAGKASNQAGDSGSRAARPVGSATRRTAAPCILACAPRVRGRTRAAP